MPDEILRANPRVLIVPGLFGSGAGHWQTEWEGQNPDFLRVQQGEWATPNSEMWLSALDQAIRMESDNVILVGHSLGSIAIALWAARYGRSIPGALLVAPSDTEADTYPSGTTGFAPVPRSKFPFPSTVVASTLDRYMAVERVKELSDAWGSELVLLGPHGHISTADGFGAWPEGLAYLDRFRLSSRRFPA